MASTSSSFPHFESIILEQESKQVEFKHGEVRTTTNNDSMVYHPRMGHQQKLPPLVTALEDAAAEDAASFHFPGHNRGRAAPSSLTKLIGQRPFLHDLPELPELDNLFAPEGPILEAQKQAAEIFGASETWFLVGGTTCGIQAAIMATCSPGDTLILPRNSHISAISAMVLSGVVPKYIFPYYDCDWDIASAVEKAIKELELEGQKPAAVFVTSPTYHGICSKLKEISDLCHSRDIPLIVDEAHGAHFGFHPQLPLSALQQGADLAVQSTHKVLCSLTQSSMLHLSGKLVDREKLCRCLQTLQSTSPSYLLLASLDAAAAQLRENPSTVFDNAIHLAIEARKTMEQIPGISVLKFPNYAEFPAIDPLRLTLGFYDLGLSGYEADDFLFKDQRIISELTGSHSITFPFTPGTCNEHVNRLVLGVKNLSSSSLLRWRKKQGMKHTDLKPYNDIIMQLNPREAFFAKKTRVNIKDTVGKICGELICPYPPGIPIMIPGELVTEGSLNLLLQAKTLGATLSGASDPGLTSMVICDV
uniref:Arginine decarboxylase n=1 Tax=Chenopodium quinoa TaxID=63459 RepID=A0A803MEV8_CHEQI